jgi:hypothetical protein
VEGSAACALPEYADVPAVVVSDGWERLAARLAFWRSLYSLLLRLRDGAARNRRDESRWDDPESGRDRC